MGDPIPNELPANEFLTRSGVAQRQLSSLPDLCRKQEAAQFLSMSVRTLERRIAEGLIKAVREGGRTLVKKMDLERYLNKL